MHVDVYRALRAHVLDDPQARRQVDFYASAALPPRPCDLADEAIWVIVHAGLRAEVAHRINARVCTLVHAGDHASSALRHAKKAKAIDTIWCEQEAFYQRIAQSKKKSDQAVLDEIQLWPFIGGPALSLHLGKNIGLQIAKPDVHLRRVAEASCETVQGLCERLSADTGDPVPVVDFVIYWAASRYGILDTRNLAQGDK